MDPNKKRDDYEADVAYEVWRSGGNPDNIDVDRVQDSFDAGLEIEEAAKIEMPKRQEAE